MGFKTENLSLYHTFSKTPVDSNTSSAAAQLGNAINKSGHTVQSNEIWTESIPFFGLAATTTAIHNKFSATAKVNDLVKDSDGKIWQRNNTAYSTSAEFADLWSEKIKSITSFAKDTDGKYTFTEADGALVDGSYLLNSEGVPTVKYYEKRLLTRLTADNNANTNSDNKASRLQIDGKWIDQFIGVTDIYLNGSAAVSYAPVLRKTSSSSPMQAGPGKGYMDYCATGLILWESSAAGTEVIDCFEYVGTKLNSTVAKLEAAVFGGSPGEGGEEDLSISEQVAKNTTAINVLNGADTVEGSVAKTVKDAIDGLGDVAVKDDIKITDIKVKQGSGEAESLTITDKSVTIEIPEVPAAVVTEAGAVTTDGFTKTADVTNLANAAIKSAILDTEGAIAEAIDGAISDATLPSGDNAIETAAGDSATKLVTAEQVKEYVTENAQVTVTVDETNITSTGFEFAGSAGTDVSVAAEMDVNGKVTYSATLSKATVDSAGAITNGDLAVSATDAKTITDKAIETALADTSDGSLGATIASKVADVTVNGASIVSDDKVAILTTTGTTAIAADGESTSTKLATEASVAKSVKALEDNIEAITTGDGSIGSRLEVVEESIAEGGTTAEAIKAAKEAADSKVSSVTGPNEGHVIVTTDPSTKAVEIKVSDIASAATLNQVQTTANSAVQSVKVNGTAVTKTDNAVDITAIVGVDETVANGIKVTKTSDNKVKVGVTTATYTAATESAAGSWSDEAQVVTAGAIKSALADVDTKHKADIEKVEAAIESLSTSGFSREIVTELPATNIKLNAIYLVANKESDANEYIEYIYVGGTVNNGQVEGGRFEQIGTTKTDLSEYAKTADVNAALDLKADQTALDSTNAEVAKKANSDDVYTKTEINAAQEATDAAIEAAQADATKALADAAAAQTAADTAQSEVDTLEGLVSALTQVVTDNKNTAEAAIATKADQTALDATNATVTEHTTAIETLQEFVGGANDAYAAKSTETAAANAQTSADKKLASITTSDNRVTLGTPTADGDTKSISISLASTVATTTDGTAYSKTETDSVIATAVGTAVQSVALAEDNTQTAISVVTSDANAVTFTVADNIATVDKVTVAEDGTITVDTEGDVYSKESIDKMVSEAAPANYVTSINGSTGAQAFTIKDGRENVYANDLWSPTVNVADGVITVQGGPIDGTAWGPKNGYNSNGGVVVNGMDYPQGSNPITKVENNMVYNETTEVANIKTNELVNGYYMFSSTPLESFSGDLSNLVYGDHMFSSTSLESFYVDLSNLVNGYFMFFSTPLTSFRSDLGSLVNGRCMFYKSSLASFSGDLSNLLNGTLMFDHTSLASFSGDLSNLLEGGNMFANTPLESFSGDLSNLVYSGSMFKNTSLTSFDNDLSNLVNGGGMFTNTPLESFSGDLSNLVTGSRMFENTSLTSFNGDLSNLVNGTHMFEYTSLDVESVELICDVLPNYNTENGGKTLQTATWTGEGKYTYSDWNGTSAFNYPIVKLLEVESSMSEGNTDNFNRIFTTDYISASDVKSISIDWKDISVLNEDDKTAITKLFTDTATEKGWTFITNAELGGTVSPNAAMAADGTIQYYVFAKKDEATEDNATHIDASGKLWKLDTAEAIIGPNIKYWSMFATVEDALTEWELTPWTKPAEEETEA